MKMKRKERMFRSHVAIYNAKAVTSGEFRICCQRIADNLGTGKMPGKIGYAVCPDGKVYAITTASRMAKPVKDAEKLGMLHEVARQCIGNPLGCLEFSQVVD